MRVRAVATAAASVGTRLTFTPAVSPALALALLCRCNGTLPSPSTVNSLRLFALTTPTPDVLPGTGARITAVWYDPTPGRTPWFRWRLCPEPASGDARDCARPAMGTDLGVETHGSVDLPAGMLTLPVGATTVDYVVYVSLCPDAAATYDPTVGHYACPSPEGIEAVRRVTVRAGGGLNQDPGVTLAWVGDGGARVPLSTDGGAPGVGTVCAGGTCTALAFGAQPAADAAEALMDGGREALQASFYATAGTVDLPRVVGAPGSTDALVSQWTPPTGSPGTVVRLWVVVRDQRGGDTVAAGAVTLR